jgi:hypothetical protein
MAYSFAWRLKTLKDLTPYENISAKYGLKNPGKLIINLHQDAVG